MLDPKNVPEVIPEEMTCRFLVAKGHVNRQTKTVKANAFLPHPFAALSVTRLIQITESEVWEIGRCVAEARTPPRTLRGRADVLAATFIGQDLEVIAAPVEGNPNHADVTGWPAEDEALQLLKAKEIAGVAKFLPPVI